MKITYDLTIDDMVAFNQYHNSTSPTVKRTKYRLIFVASFIAIGLSLVIKPTPEFTRLEMVTVAVGYSIFCFLLTLYLFRSSARRFIPRLLKESSNKGLIGWHELEVDKDGLVEKTEVNETRHSWLGISKIVETETHAFIFVSSIMAHVIPKNSISSGNVDQFITQAKLYYSENSGDKLET